MDILETEWRWRLMLARETRTASARRRLAHRAYDGELTRVLRGVYVDSAYWRALGSDDRFRLKVQAAAAKDPALVFSHAAAAAVWGLPWRGPWPERLDVLGMTPAGPTTVLRRHAEAPDEVAAIDGIRVTGLARTVVDVARGSDLLRAVMVVDAALNPGTRSKLRMTAEAPDLERALDAVPAQHGEARARHAIDFADARAESPGESVSRISIDRLGLSSPVLQQEFVRRRERYRVDFWWPEYGVVGEFDGVGKYREPELLAGRTPEEVVYEEKRREDEIRRLPEVAGFARWGWNEAVSPPRLAAVLNAAGVPLR